MTQMLDDLTDLTSLRSYSSASTVYFVTLRKCDACGEIKDDVDLWATDSDTGEEIWLRLACGE